MFKFINLALLTILLVGALTFSFRPMENSIYDFEVADIDGNKVSLADYKGKELLIVNVASRCGYTPQYADLQETYEAHKDKAVVLGFPANNFGGQEPGTNAEIKSFCTSKFDVTFPMFSKISVKGKDQHALYKFLEEKTGDRPSWNFCKYHVSADGTEISFYKSGVKPQEIIK